MTHLIVLGLFTTWLLGGLVLLMVWRPVVPPLRALPLLLIVAYPVGLAVTSSVYFLWLIALSPWGVPYPTVEALALAAALAGAWNRLAAWRRRLSADRMSRIMRIARPNHVAALGRLAMIPAMITGLVMLGASTVTTLSAEPFGFWDAWAIWNLKAIFLFNAAPDWTHLFSPEVPHPAYPLLHPIAVARLWHYSGTVTPFAPQTLALCNTLTCVLLVATGLILRGGVVTATVAALATASSLLLHQRSGWQYADITLCLIMVAALAIMLNLPRMARHQSGPLAILGLMLGAAAWTKNEGIVFMLTGLAVVMIMLALQSADRRDRLRTMLRLGMGTAAGLAAWLGQWWLFPVQTDLFAQPRAQPITTMLTDGDRHRQILDAIHGITSHVTTWPVVIATMLAIVLLAERRGARRPALAIMLAACLLAQAGAYYAVFLITPHDLLWHLGTALDRLTLHLWPTGIFVIAALAATIRPRRT